MRIPKQELISRVVGMQDGNPADFDFIYGAYREYACRTARKCGCKENDVEDVVQEAFIRAYTNIRRLKVPGAFQGWLGKIILNCVRGAYQKRAPLLGGDTLEAFADILPERSEHSQPELRHERTERQMTVLSAVDRLPKQQKYAVINHYFLGKKIKEIAKAQNLTEGAVKNALHNARISLKKTFEEIW